MQWAISCIVVKHPYHTDANGLNMHGWLPGTAICAGWPQIINGEAVPGTMKDNMFTYRAGGLDGAFDLLKVSTMSQLSPPALCSAARDMSPKLFDFFGVLYGQSFSPKPSLASFPFSAGALFVHKCRSCMFCSLFGSGTHVCLAQV